MFNRKKCEKCGNKISSKFDFCPYCGKPANGNVDEDFGMLGKNDSFDEFDNFSKSIFGGFGGGMLNKMLGNAVKMLEKEMQKEMHRSVSPQTLNAGRKKTNSQPRTNFQMFINGKKVNLGEDFFPVQKQKAKKTAPVKLPQNKLKNFSKLPRENPKADIRRFSNKIVYEINVPGVKSIDDVSIIQLENSIEIKAVSKEKSYAKILPINLPIINYGLDNQKILLELAVSG